jgi:hypothetical protein
MPYQIGSAPPGLRGYLMSRQNQQVEQQAEMQGLMGMLRLKQAQEEAAQRAQMQPLQMELMKAQVEAQRQAAQAAPQKAAMEAALKQAQLDKARREAQQFDIQNTGLSGLLQQMTRPYQSPQGVAPTDGSQGAPDMVAPNDQAAIQALQAAGGRPMRVDVANPGLTQAYQVMANPQRAIPELIKQQRPQTANESPIARVMRERAALPPGDPRGPLMDKYIEKLSSHQPGVNVYSSSLQPAQDAQGNPVLVQPSGREDVPPRVIPGLSPLNKEAGGVAGETAGKVAMADQGIMDIRGVRDILFKDGKMDRKLVAAMNLPFSAGMPFSAEARDAYSKIYNAVEAKLRIETGAAATTREVQSIVNRFLPRVMDPDSVAAGRLDRLEEFMKTTLDQTKGVRKDKLRSGNVPTPAVTRGGASVSNW